MEGCRWKVAGGRLQVEGCRWQVAGGRLQVEGCRLQVAGCRWQVAGGRLQVAGCRWQVAGGRLQVEGCRYTTCNFPLATCNFPLFPHFAPFDRCAIVLTEPCGVRDRPEYGASQHSINGSIAKRRGCDSPASARARRTRSAGTHLHKQVRTHWYTRHCGVSKTPSESFPLRRRFR